MARCTVIGRVHATDLSMSPGKRDSIFRNSQYDRFAGCLWVLAKRSPRSFQRQSGGSPGVLPRAGDIFSYPAVSIHGETTLKGFLSETGNFIHPGDVACRTTAIPAPCRCLSPSAAGSEDLNQADETAGL